MPSHFPTGVVIFFRAIMPDGNLARAVHPRGRSVDMASPLIGHDDDYIVLDEHNTFLGCYPREFIAAILPLEIVPEQTQAEPILTRQ